MIITLFNFNIGLEGSRTKVDIMNCSIGVTMANKKLFTLNFRI